MNSKLASILLGTCPKCHGDCMYENKNPYIITQTMKMHNRCSKCDFKYKVEPNFFFGAMYVSYGLSVMHGVFTFLICHYAFNAGITDSFIAILVTLVLLMPIITRLSRNIYINLFISYDKNAGLHKVKS